MLGTILAMGYAAQVAVAVLAVVLWLYYRHPRHHNALPRCDLRAAVVGALVAGLCFFVPLLLPVALAALYGYGEYVHRWCASEAGGAAEFKTLFQSQNDGWHAPAAVGAEAAPKPVVRLRRAGGGHGDGAQE